MGGKRISRENDEYAMSVGKMTEAVMKRIRKAQYQKTNAEYEAAKLEAAKAVNVEVSNSQFDDGLSVEIIDNNDGWADSHDILDSGYPQDTISYASEDTSKIEQLSDCDTDECMDLDTYHELLASHKNKQEKQKIKEQKIQNKAKRMKWWQSIKQNVAEHYISWKNKAHGERWTTYTPNLDRRCEHCSCTRSCSLQTKETLAFHHFGMLIMLKYRWLMYFCVR